MRLKNAAALAPGSLFGAALASADEAAGSGHPHGQGWRAHVRIIFALLLMAACAGGWLVWRQLGGWEGAVVWLMQTRQALHQQLASALQAVAAGATSATASLLGLSLLYGVFHAAGPGHGKAVIATYLGTHAVHIRRGVLLSVLAALAQGLVAIVLIEAVEAVALSGLSLRRAQAITLQAENLSFALLVAVGAVLAARSLWALWRHRQGRQAAVCPPAGSGGQMGGARMQPWCAACVRRHGPTRAHLQQPLSWRSSVGIILAIGLRPCTGAVLVLLFAHAFGLRWTALAAVLVMSLGTAATVATLAVLTVSLRQGATGLLRRVTRSGACLGLLFNLLGAGGGLLLCVMGASLLQQGWRSAAHPLL